MARPFQGKVTVDIRDSVPDWSPYEQPKAADGAPNVLMIVWDDVGYGAMSVFGGPIETPTMERIAGQGLRYSNFHTTALCSPTRSSLLNGRNATSNGSSCQVPKDRAAKPSRLKSARRRNGVLPRSSVPIRSSR